MMKKIIRLKESELIDLIKKSINEQGDLMLNVTRGQRNCANASLERKDRRLARQDEKNARRLQRRADREGKDVQSYTGKWAELKDKEMDENLIDDTLDKYKNYFSEVCLSDADTIVKAAITDSNTFNNLSERYSKYFQNGKLDPKYQPRDIGSTELIFFKNYFPQQTKISVGEILDLFATKLGGVKNYESVVNSFYKIR